MRIPRTACAAGVLVLSACGAHPSAVRSTPATSAPVTSAPLTVATTPAPTTTAPIATRTTVAAAPLAFDWTVAVSGLTVTVGGSWTGTDATLTARQVSADRQISSAAAAGSGVLAYGATVLTASGAQVPAGTAPAEADFTVGVWSTDGDVPPSCAGPVTAQRRALAPKALHFARPGTYQVVMRTTSCAGSRTDTKTFTVS